MCVFVPFRALGPRRGHLGRFGGPRSPAGGISDWDSKSWIGIQGLGLGLGVLDSDSEVLDWDSG